MVSAIMRDGAKYGLGNVVGSRPLTAKDRQLSEETTKMLMKEMGISRSSIRFE